MRERLFRGTALAGVAIASAFHLTPAMAQDAKGENVIPEGEIVVTAAKRSESL